MTIGAGSTYDITDTLVADNTATGGSDNIVFATGVTGVFTRNTVTGNVVSSHHAGIYAPNSDVNLVDCKFYGNIAGGAVGAVRVDGAGTTLSITGCEFVGNSVGGASGAIHANNAELYIFNR